MQFDLCMEGSSVKLFRSAVQALCKIDSNVIGLQLYPNKILLKCVDETESGMMVVELPSTFFTIYKVDLPPTPTPTPTASSRQPNSQWQQIDVVISIKDILIVLRNKQIVKLSISRVQGEFHRVKFTTTISAENTGAQQTRRYFVKQLDGVEIQDLEVDLNSYCTCVIAQTSEMLRLLGQFRSNGEICLMLDENNRSMPVGLMDYTNPVLANTKFQWSVCVTDTDQIFRFAKHTREGASEATVLVAHFKALVSLCAELMCNVKIFVDEPGQTMVVAPEPTEPHQDVALGVQLFLATLDFSLAEKMKQVMQQQQQQQQGVRGGGGNTAATSLPNTELLTPADVVMTPLEMLRPNANHTPETQNTPNQAGGSDFDFGVPPSF